MTRARSRPGSESRSLRVSHAMTDGGETMLVAECDGDSLGLCVDQGRDAASASTSSPRGAEAPAGLLLAPRRTWCGGGGAAVLSLQATLNAVRILRKTASSRDRPGRGGRNWLCGRRPATSCGPRLHPLMVMLMSFGTAHGAHDHERTGTRAPRQAGLKVRRVRTTSTMASICRRASRCRESLPSPHRRSPRGRCRRAGPPRRRRAAAGRPRCGAARRCRRIVPLCVSRMR